MCCLPYKSTPLHNRNTSDVFSSALSSSTHRFPLGELSHTHTELMQLEPGSTLRAQPAALPGKPSCGQLLAAQPQNLCATPGARLIPAARGHWQGRFESPGVPMGCSQCSALALLSPHSELPTPTEGCEDGAARAPSSLPRTGLVSTQQWHH